jgi:hypothetical protein
VLAFCKNAFRESRDALPGKSQAISGVAGRQQGSDKKALDIPRMKSEDGEVSILIILAAC